MPETNTKQQQRQWQQLQKQQRSRLLVLGEKQGIRPKTGTAGASACAPHSSSGCSHALLKAEPIKGFLLALTVLAFLLRIAYKSVKFLTSLLSQCKQSCCHDLLLWDGAGACYQPNCGVLL